RGRLRGTARGRLARARPEARRRAGRRRRRTTVSQLRPPAPRWRRGPACAPHLYALRRPRAAEADASTRAEAIVAARSCAAPRASRTNRTQLAFDLSFHAGHILSVLTFVAGIVRIALEQVRGGRAVPAV